MPYSNIPINRYNIKLVKEITMEINNNLIINIEDSNDLNWPSYWSIDGCENCDTGIPCDCYAVEAMYYEDEGDCSIKKQSYYFVDLCQSCFNAFFGKNSLPEDCKNIFKI